MGIGPNHSNLRQLRVLCKKTVIPTILYGSQLLNNIPQQYLDKLQIFQHFIAKHILNSNKRQHAGTVTFAGHGLLMQTLVFFAETMRL